MNAVQLGGSSPEYPTPDDEAELHYDPLAIVDDLCRTIRSPLKLAPLTVTERLVAFLSDSEQVFDLFEHAANGESIAEFAHERNLSYFALNALYESPNEPFVTMRRIVSSAISREDRERARKAVRARNGYISQDRKRYVDALLDLSKAENPDQHAPTASSKTVVQVGFNFGQALGNYHRSAYAARQPVTIEHKPDPKPANDLSDLL